MFVRQRMVPFRHSQKINVLTAVLVIAGAEFAAPHTVFAQTPAAPTGFTVTGGTSQLTLTWNNTAGLTYNVYRWTSGTEPTTPTYTGKTSVFTDTGLTNGTQYVYRISGVNSSHVEGPQASSVIAVPVATPTGVTTKAGNGVVSLAWGVATGALRYSIYRSTTAGAETLLATDVSTLSYADTGVNNGTAYYYKVSGVRKDPTGYSTTESALSSEVSATPLTTLPAAPSGLAAVPGNGQVILSWGTITGATGYKLYRSLNVSGGPYTLLASPTTTGYTDTTAINGTATNPRTYYYVVTAVTSVGASAYSNEAAASPGVSTAAGAILFDVADTTANSANPSVIYGYHNLMYAGNTGSSTNMAYVKFDLSSVSGTVTSALLKLDATSTISGLTASVSPVLDTTWTETALNWTNHPSLGTAIVSASIPTTETNPTWDVTSYIRSQQLAGNKLVTLALTQDAANAVGITIRARESGTPPQLILVTSGPTAPAGLTAVGGLGQVSLSWGRVPGSTGYIVQRSTTSGSGYTTLTASPTSATTYLDNNSLSDGAKYYYVIAAVNSTGTGANSNEASAVTTLPTATGITATAGNGQVTVSWTKPIAATGCDVLQATTSGGPYTTVAQNVSAGSWIDRDLNNGTAYYYVVAPVTAAARGANSTEANATPQEVIPTALPIITPTSGDSKVSIAWTPVAGARRYNLYRSTGTAGAEGSIPYQVGLNSSPYVDTAVTNGTIYYYQMTAVNGAGEGSNSGEISSMPQAATAPVTTLTSAQAIQIAQTFCQTIGAPVTDTATAIYPAPDRTGGQQSPYWRTCWLVKLGAKAEVEVADATSVITWYHNYDLSQQLVTTQQPPGTPISTASATQCATAALQATSQAESLDTVQTTQVQLTQPASAAGNIWVVSWPRKNQNVPYHYEQATVQLQAETGAIRSLSLNFPSPPPAALTPSVTQSQAVSTANAQLASSGITGLTLQSTQMQWVQSNAFWQTGSSTPQLGAARMVWNCYYSSSAGIADEVWVDSQTGSVIGGMTYVKASAKRKDKLTFKNLRQLPLSNMGKE
ncbi:hypothetical protein CCAX7_37650 [Capsulimonas corticalis]|uniref:Uncharacterized protein n=1 Tax=Capsulimonas corticalis TaxID=2219043 RepID=A0A402D108_9BACT|nr:hypothetical protein [Capsulimonas corticalis]BDI31714.1 hypothetical protein CCAX7_37650 [Capsulimonas corticalis]